jgi:hypothetical protein
MDHRAPQSTVDHCQAGVMHSMELHRLTDPVDGSSPQKMEKGEGSWGILTTVCMAAQGLSWLDGDEQ